MSSGELAEIRASPLVETASHSRLAIIEVDPAIARLGAAASFAWDEFFSAMISNRNTRLAYLHAVKLFLRWIEQKKIPLEQVQPGMVGAYFNQHPASIPTKKLHLAACRSFFDVLVQRHVLVLNPASSVRAERYQTVEGKTPEITDVQARQLLQSIDVARTVGKRDKALIATLIYTAARAGAIASLRIKDLVWDGSQYSFRFAEKGGKSRLIPVRHDLQLLLLDYLDSFQGQYEPKDAPLFRSIAGRTGLSTREPIRNIDVCRMIKRRLRDANLPSHLSPHSFRVATVTDLLRNGTPLEDVQTLAGHADPRTTRLYDRRQKQVTRNLVERISI